MTDQRLAHCPTWDSLANRYWDFLAGADLIGYNITHFDAPLLRAEFRRAGIAFVDQPHWHPHIIDVGTLYRRKESRRLSHAVMYYLNRPPTNAHSAEGDVRDTLDILAEQLRRYPDIPHDIPSLAAIVQPRTYETFQNLEPSVQALLMDIWQNTGTTDRLQTIIDDLTQ